MNALPPAASPVPRLTETRVVLALIAVFMPGMGLATWNVSLGFDPMLGRLIIAALATAILVGSYRSRALLPRLHLVVQALAHLQFLWYAVVAHVNELTQIDVLGLISLALIAPTFARTGRELGSSLTIQSATLLSFALFIPTPGFPPIGMAIICLAMSVGFGGLALSRARLEDRLSDANHELESKVAERTAALEATLRRVEAESAERQRAERAAIRASRAKSSFLANMSHELRTPLNAILGYSEMVADELAGERDDLVTDLDNVRSAGTHLLGLIDGLLDLSRVEAQELDLRCEPVDVKAAVDDALMLLGTQSESAPIHVDVDTIHVQADASRLRQVFANLLANAQQHTPSGSITVSTREEGERVLIDITDTGVGIAPADLATIFERFTQVDPLQGGVGLGLAVCRMLLDQMGGSIHAESEPGVGSRFTVTCLRATAEG